MGALTRATRNEIAVLTQPEWDDVFAGIAGGGSLKVVCEERGWAYGELWRTISEDDDLARRYDLADRGRAEYVHDECIPIADKSGDANLMTRERRKSAAVWNRERHGERTELTVRRPVESEEVLLARVRALVAANPGLRDIVVGSGVVIEAELPAISAPVDDEGEIPQTEVVRSDKPIEIERRTYSDGFVESNILPVASDDEDEI